MFTAKFLKKTQIFSKLAIKLRVSAILLSTNVSQFNPILCKILLPVECKQFQASSINIQEVKAVLSLNLTPRRKK